MQTPEHHKIESITYFFRFFKPYSGWIVLTLITLFAGIAAVTYEPIALKNIIDWLTDRTTSTQLTTLVIVYFVSKVLAVIFDLLRDYFWSPVIYSVSRDIEQSVYNHLLDLPIYYHADQKSGAAVRAVVRGSTAVAMVLDVTVTRLFPPAVQLVAVSIILLKLYSWQFSVITLVSIILYVIFIIWSNEKRIKYRVAGNKKDDESSGVLVDSITNIETVKYFNTGKILFHNWQGLKSEWISLMTRNNRIFALAFAAQSLILLVGLGLILVIATKQAEAGIITVGSLVLIINYILQLSGPIAILGFVYGQYKNSFADLNAMVGILNQPVSVPEPTDPIEIKKARGEVEFNDVMFSYPGREAVINNLDFTIKPGENVAFVGSSGAGKSTIAKLIFRLFDVDSGSVTIDGIDVRQLSMDARRQILAIVPQEPALFNDTIINNIRFSKPDASKEDVISAAKNAQIHDFIDTLPDKYDTKVGERGMKISGGQKQRIAIARAILKDPKVLLFDEATSSLDSKTEQDILKTLDKVAKGRTTIAIAHRLSTIINSDRIFVLKDGKVAEVGTHNQLLKKQGVYASLWKLQSHSKQTRDIESQVVVKPVDAESQIS